MHRIVIGAALSLTVALPPAFADEARLIPTEIVREVEGWLIGYSDHLGTGDGYQACLALTEYRDGTTVVVAKDHEGDWWFSAANKKWKSIEPGKKYKVTYQIDRSRWTGNDSGAVSDVGPALISAGVKDAFIRDFARASGMRITFQGKQITALSLAGTSAAVSAVGGCYDERISDSRQSDDPFDAAVPDNTSQAQPGNVPALNSSQSVNLDFDKYEVAEIYNGTIRLPDFDGRDKIFSSYRTKIREEIDRDGVNFAGYFTLVEIGCGTSCGLGYIIDARDGHVFEIPMPDNDTYPTFRHFKKTSRLLAWQEVDPDNRCVAKQFEWEDNRLAHLSTQIVGASDACWTDYLADRPDPSSTLVTTEAPPSKGDPTIILSASEISLRLHPEQKVTIGEKLSLLELGRRFSDCRVTSEFVQGDEEQLVTQIDCDGAIVEFDLGESGEIIGFKSDSAGVATSDGVKIGDPITKAVGSPNAFCDLGMEDQPPLCQTTEDSSITYPVSYDESYKPKLVGGGDGWRGIHSVSDRVTVSGIWVGR